MTRGDLQHVAAHSELSTKCLEFRRALKSRGKKVARHEKFPSERVRFLLDGRSGVMGSAEEVVGEFVGDREPLRVLRLSCGKFDSIVDEPRAERAEVVALDDAEVLAARDRRDRNWWTRDSVIGQDAAGEGASVRWMRTLLTPWSAGNSEQLLRAFLLVRIHGHRVGAALDALRREPRPLEEAVLTFRVCAAEKWHRREGIDFCDLPVQDTLGEHESARSERRSRLCRDAGRAPVSLKGAAMNDRDKELFEQVDQFRSRNGGLSDQLERYRRSREEYEKLIRGRDEAPSVPLERGRRQRAAGRLKGAIDRDS